MSDPLKEALMTRSRLLVALLTAGVLIALTAAVSSAGAARQAGASRSVVHLIGHETDVAQLDLGAAGPSLGDEVVFSGQLQASDESRQIGHFEGTLTAVTPDANSRFLAFVVLALPDGQITVEGELDFATETEFVHAVTGGTGAFRDARGEFTFRHTDTKGVIAITLHLDQP
jgi:hypothetical protein